MSKSKLSLFQTKIRFLGHYVIQGTIIPIKRSIKFADNFSDKILEKNPTPKISRKSQLCHRLLSKTKQNMQTSS